MEDTLTVADDERVARILSEEWFIDGILQAHAFTLRENETYVSVYRLSVPSYSSDVAFFVERHPQYQFASHTYKRALLSVSAIRHISVDFEGAPLNVSVEVEPRSMLTKSHAGIFTRYGKINIKRGVRSMLLEKGICADDILLEVRAQLMSISTIEHCPLK